MSKRIYRTIWEQVNGPIPIDENGISYEIHHIDGDRTNNDISNLMCITIQEHYDIHKKQKDYGACRAISSRMKLTKEERSKLQSEHAKGLAKQGKMFFQTEAGREWTKQKNRERAKKGVHPAQTPEFRAFASENAKKRNSILNSVEWTCDVCGKVGKGRANLVRHQRSKTCVKSEPRAL